MKKYVVATQEGTRCSCLLNNMREVERVGALLKRGWPDINWQVYELEYTPYNKAGFFKGKLDTAKLADQAIRENLIEGIKRQPKLNIEVI
jgi:hypothetical protein